MFNFWGTGAPRILKIQWFPLSILIFGQTFCFLGPTIFRIPQPNWYYKVSPFDGLNGDKNYYSKQTAKLDFGCKRECKRTHYKMDITVGDVDLIPFQKYVESGQNTSINASEL